MIDLALKTFNQMAMTPRDALLITAGLVSGVLLWQVEERFSRLRDREGRRD